MVVLPDRVVAMSKPRKGKNFNQEKETQLCRIFLHVLQDHIIGKAQKSQAFWECACRHFNSHMPV
jgi:hypothetical protein